MMVTFEDQQAALAAILGTISGLTIEVDYPDAIQRRDLPCVVIALGEATYDRVQRGANSLRITRSGKLLLFGQEAALGREYQSEKVVKPFLTSIPVALAAYPTATLADGTGFEIVLLNGRDSGPIPITYNQKLYVGAVLYFSTVVEAYIAAADSRVL